MYSQAWTNHLKSTEEQEQFYKAVLAAKPVLERLSQLMDVKEKSLTLRELSLENYNEPNWAYRQAHQNGFRQCLTSFQQLITFDQKENNDPRQPIRVQG